MFKFLKEKISNALKRLKKKIEEEAETQTVVVEKEVPTEKETKKTEKEKKKTETKEKKSEEKTKLEKKRIEPEEKKKDREKEEIRRDEVKEKEKIKGVEEEKEEKKGFFKKIKEKIITKKISESKFEDLFWDLELALLENNIAFEVVEKIKQDLKAELINKPLPRRKIEEIIKDKLKQSLEEILSFEKFNLIERIKSKKPFVIVFFGINGSGKTTTIAKLAYLLKQNGLKPVVVASDTFRAAAIQQLEEHANNLEIKLIKHDYGADPAAVAFDAIRYAKARNIDVVLIDTAGRMHSNINLMDEMKKIVRVAKPDMKIFVGEAITGNDAVEQAKKFNDAIGIDGIILTKADIDEKGGATISVSWVTGKPILYLGIGQEYNALKEFNKDEILASLGF